MAIPFRNLQGGNPYQGLANTMESVSSRVGATFMSYAQAKRQRDDERARLKAEKEKSMVDAIVKLVPAAVGYEQQKDAFEYKKEQDTLDRQFRQEESRKTADYRQTMLEGQIARDERIDEFRTQTFNEQKRSNQAREGMETKKYDAILEENRQNKQFRQWQRENTANENKLNAEERARTQKYQQDSLELKKSTPLEQSNMANSMAININKSKAQRYSNLYDKYRIWAGLGSLDGKVAPALDGKNLDSKGNPKMGFADWVEDDVNGLGLPEGYVSGLLTETTYEDVLAQHNIALPAGTPTPKVVTNDEDDLSVINKVIEENTPKDGPPPAVVNEPQSVLANPPAVVEKAPEDAPDIFVEDESGKKRLDPNKIGSAFANYDISNKPNQSELLEVLVTDDVPEDEEPGFVDYRGNLGIGQVGASEDTRVRSENRILKRDEDGNIVPDEFKMITKSRGRNINVRSGPKAQPKEANVVDKLKPGTEVTVIGYQDEWMEVRFINKDGKEVTGWIKNTGLTDLK